MQIKEITVSSKRSISHNNQFFTFECMETISIEPKDDVDKVKREAYERCNIHVDNQCIEVIENI